MKLWYYISILLLLSGCARISPRIMGDDQAVKFSALKADYEASIAKIEGLEMELKAQPQVAGQVGLTNLIQQELRDMRYEISAGGDSVFNDIEVFEIIERILNKFLVGVMLMILLSSLFGYLKMRAIISRDR